MDLTASQAQPAAEQARSRRQTSVEEAHHGGRVVGPHRHPRVDDRAALACGGEAPGPTTAPAGHEAFAPRAAGAARRGAGHRGRGPAVGHVRLVQAPQDVLRRGRGGEGSAGGRAPHGAHPPRLPRLTHGRVRERQTPARAWRTAGGRVRPRVSACATWAPPGAPSRAAVGWPPGRGRAPRQPAAGSAMLPGVRPHGAGHWLVPGHIGALVGASA